MLLNTLIGLALVLSVFLAVSLFASLLVAIQFVPTPLKMVDAMVTAAGLKAGDKVYDLGAGDGRLLFRAAKRHPGIQAIGIEFVPSVLMWGKIRSFFGRHPVKLRWGDLFRHQYHDADVVFLYLYPNVLSKLEKKFDQELKRGTKVISHAFKFPNKTPMKSETVQFGEKMKTFHVYEW